MRAASEGPGTGSEFVVCLPLAPQRILIADDNEDAARSLAMLLEMSGHETRVVTDGAQAVAAAAKFQTHVAILDIAMSVVD